jgi:putative ABC transport system permease protein
LVIGHYLVFSDLKFALRLLAKSPVFAAIAVLTLAVGIGTATVIFSAVNALFLKPIPFIQDVDRLLYFTEADLKRGHDDLGLNYSDFRDLRARMTTLEGMWVHTDRTIIMSGTADPERLIGTDISAEAFQWMGVQPTLGRNFVPADEQRNAPRVALLSYGLWQRRFGGSNDVLNSNVTLNGETVTVIGVMPKGWGYPDLSDLWMPLRIEEEKQNVRGSFWLNGPLR